MLPSAEVKRRKATNKPIWRTEKRIEPRPLGFLSKLRNKFV